MEMSTLAVTLVLLSPKSGKVYRSIPIFFCMVQLHFQPSFVLVDAPFSPSVASLLPLAACSSSGGREGGREGLMDGWDGQGRTVSYFKRHYLIHAVSGY